MNIPLGNSTPPGWTAIVAPLLAMAEKEGASVMQIKEKFGSLRFYVDGASDTLLKAIIEAEGLSAITCQQCGKPGTLREKNGWLRTLCDEHVNGPFRSDSFPPLSESSMNPTEKT